MLSISETKGNKTMWEYFKMFLNLDGFGKWSSVSRIPKIPAFGNSGHFFNVSRIVWNDRYFDVNFIDILFKFKLYRRRIGEGG